MGYEAGINFTDTKTALKEREFNLTACKILRVNHTFYDERNERNETANLILFTFEQNSEAALFLSAYYEEAYPHPKTGISGIELPVYLNCVGMFAKVRLNWPNKHCDRPHLFLMSVGVEAAINARKELNSTDLKIFPESKTDELGLSDGRVRAG